jgi:hypothetical protein
MTNISPVSNLGRYLDIMKQGFMKPLPKPRPVKTPPPIIACNDCLNWHRQGKHTADLQTRRANRAEHRAREKSA